MKNIKDKQAHFFHFLNENAVVCSTNAENSEQVIRELTGKIKEEVGLSENDIVDAVLAREKVTPTVIAPGLAVPHARMENVDKLTVAFATSLKGIDFNTPGMPKVNVIILILTPKDDPSLHLQVLAALAKDFQDLDLVRKVAAMETPSEIISFFSENKGEIPEYLKARDIMNNSPTVLLEGDNLSTAIECFSVKKIMDIPILDHENDLRGIITLEDILKLSLPEHLLWMNDLSPIMKFQPFTELLRNDRETKIADFMREDFVSVDENVPAIQLAKLFMIDKIRQILVTKNSKLSGVVNIQGFITKLFWA